MDLKTSSENFSNPLIIFFDGHCHLCNGYIDFLSHLDTDKKIFYAPLQGETAKKILLENNLISENDLKKIENIIFYKSGVFLKKSTAVIESLAEASLFFNLLKISYIVPLFIRDWLYDLIAKNRYRFFGYRETCRLPSADDLKNLLK